MFVPAGMDEEDVSLADLDPILDHLWRKQVEFLQLIAQIHDHTLAIEPIEGKLINGFATRDKMARGIHVSADVVGGLDILGIYSMLGFSFEVLDFEGWIERPERYFLVEWLR